MTQVMSVWGGLERFTGAKSNPKGSQGRLPAGRSGRPIGAMSGANSREIREMDQPIGIEPTTFSLESGAKPLNVLARVHRRIGLQDRRVATRLEIAVSSVDGRSPIIYPKLKRSAMPSETLRNGPSGLFWG
ncbi:hypothetical protein J2Y55_003471 [Bosea sp. BE125]|uniref:hypothetical protein n=1 Tax=Bosea sp. BE125 TaxID=2817909 RepID=UPI00286309DE|nr:hypothetical protein [Bosea sp. BE125]MDR6872455.1 hypothetical protein [Bosea sp. BE125]